jgi:hypothetical protein
MRRDVTYLTAGGSRRHGLTGLSRWLVIGLGGALVLALILAQVVRAAGEMIVPDAETLTISEGAQDVYKVSLAGDAPAAGADVTVAITSDNTDVTVNPALLTFTSTNHEDGQNVVVTVGQDSDAIDERATLTHTVGDGSVYSAETVTVNVTDDDEIGIDISETELSISETADDPATPDDTELDANQDTYTVTVGAAPESAMEIAIAGDPDGKVTVSPATLSFATDATYPNVQTVTVSVDADGTTHDESVTLTHTVTGGSTAYRALSGQTVTVEVRDSNEAGLAFTSDDSTVITSISIDEGDETGGTYQVALSAEPTDDVTVTISSTNGDVKVDTDATADDNQNTLTFLAAVTDEDGTVTASNFAIPQTVTVTAVEDADNAADSAMLRHTITSDDANYAALAPTFEVEVTDTNAGISISETALMIDEVDDTETTDVTENVATYTVTVQAVPAAAMTITIDADPAGKVTLSGGAPTLSFGTTDTYPLVRNVTVTAVGDATTIDDTVRLTHTVTGGSAAYRAFSGRVVTVTVTDDDEAGFTFGDLADAGALITSRSVTEGAPAVSYTVELATPPVGDVTVAISSSNSDVTVSPSSLTFNNEASGKEGSWVDPQTVMVTAAEDGNNVGESVTLTHTASSADDSSYNGFAGELMVSVMDNDAGIGLSPMSLMLSESADDPATEDVETNANVGTYTVSVQGTPVHSVVVTITGTGSGATLDSTVADADQPVLTQTLTFTTTNFADAQTVTVTAREDDDNMDASLTLAHAIASNDARYNTGDAGSVTVSVTDDEPSVTIDPSMLDAIVEGETGMFSVTLDNDPDDPATTGADEVESGMVAISSDNADVTFSTGDGTPAATLTLEFTGGEDGNHGTAQMVTVHVAADEDEVDEPSTITLAISGGVYEGLPVSTLSLQIKEPTPEPVTVRVPGPTQTVTQTRTVTRTVTETVEVPVAAEPNVIGGSMSAMATEVDGRVLITRHDGGPSLVVDIGGFIRDESLGQTYQVVRRMDGMIVRQWVSPNSPLVYQIPWSIVNTQFTVPVGVIMSIPLDDQSGSEGQLVRRFDGSGDDRIFSYAGMGQWRHIPDIATLQALGYYWCDMTAADSEFFNRISIGPAHPPTDQPASMDYPTCSTG